jgi:hypothetical protein
MQLGAEVVQITFRGTGFDRHLRIELIKDKAECCHGSLKFEAIVQTPSKSLSAPLEIEAEQPSTLQDFKVGDLAVKGIRLKLTRAELKRKIKARLYSDIVADDSKCMGDAIDAMIEGGLTERKKLRPFLEVGCIHQPNYPMFLDGAEHLSLVRGKRIGYAMLFPVDLESSESSMLNGWILTDRIREGLRPQYYAAQDSRISGEILVKQ